MTVSTSEIVRARALRHAATPPERLLWRFLRTLRSDGFHFRRQVPFRGYVLDFACYSRRLVIEVDGAQHGIEAQGAHDAIRDAVLAREGFCTVRLLAADVSSNLEGVRIAILEHLAAPHPGPPHAGEGKSRTSPSPAWEGWGEGTARRSVFGQIIMTA